MGARESARPSAGPGRVRSRSAAPADDKGALQYLPGGQKDEWPDRRNAMPQKEKPVENRKPITQLLLGVGEGTKAGLSSFRRSGERIGVCSDGPHLRTTRRN